MKPSSRDPALRPVYTSCRSNSSRSRAAARLAHELADRQDALALSLEEIGSDASRAVVAVDGCSSACGARLLETHGLSLAASLTLDDLDASGEPDLREAELLVERGAHQRRQRLPAPVVAGATAPSRAHALEDYLIAVDSLTSPIGTCGAPVENAPTLAAHVATVLGVSRPTAGEILTRLEHDGLIDRGPSRELVLSPRGRQLADRAIRAHRLLECFVVELLGFDAAESFGRARQLAPSFDDEAISRLAETLGHPELCPHAWPVDPVAARAAALELVSLGALGAGREATVEMLPEDDPAALDRLVELGIGPGTIVAGTETNADGSIGVRVAGRVHRLDRTTAAATLVRPLIAQA